MSDDKTKSKVTYIGIGESEDPMPDFPQVSGYRVFAASCKDCGCSGRKLLPSGNTLSLFCDKCNSELKTILQTSQWAEISYVYWCNSSKFASDEVNLENSDLHLLEEEVKKLGPVFEMPHWAVMIVSGRCCQSDFCINTACVYRSPSI